jgi:hypothetical protein
MAAVRRFAAVAAEPAHTVAEPVQTADHPVADQRVPMRVMPAHRTQRQRTAAVAADMPVAVAAADTLVVVVVADTRAGAGADTVMVSSRSNR